MRLEEFDLMQITEPLLQWFSGHARVLPWREQITPYRVWVSEIMLQQTRVEAVKPYFERFMTALPTISDLASCEEEKLLKLWEGLGYYNRVRNLQTAAKTLVEVYDGELPADYEELLKLKGIGHYTAGAIGSIAYGIPMPAVDGNVLRVLMRVAEDDSDIMKQSVKNKVETLLQEMMPKDRAADFNQALMELGATVCLPNGAPKCEECPWTQFCQARINDSWSGLPVKKADKARCVEKRTILIIRDENRIVLRKRPKKGLLAGMYEFPNTEGYLDREAALQTVRDMNLAPLHIQELEQAKHIFSHVEWHMTGYMIRVDSLELEQTGELFVDTKTAEASYPIPAAFRAYTKYMNIQLGNEKFQ